MYSENLKKTSPFYNFSSNIIPDIRIKQLRK